MKKNEWSFGLMEIAYIIAFTVAGAYLIYRGVVSENLLVLLGGVVLLLIGGGILWINISMRAHFIEERLTHPLFIELRSFFGETLLPLGFKEEQGEDGLGFSSKYTREEIFITLGKDFRDSIYFFQVGSKSKTINVAGNTLSVPDPDFSIESDPKNIESFKKEVRDKLSEWLAEQKIK
ncbi:MAG TPA: hypothetical protein VI753_11075 [Anaerolineales bacterium]|nr:hypothetical protein [Anaerolineales bacterium]